MTRPDSALIEPRFKESIDYYVRQHRPTGAFLRNVLANDLAEAVLSADPKALINLPHILAYIYNEIPGACWGDQERVRRWLAKGGRNDTK